jgi:hypothetical protein
MSTLTLILPCDVPRHRSAALERRLARARHRSLAESGWRSWLAQALGHPEIAGQPPARFASGEPGAWFATPVHLVAGVDHVQMAARGWLRLSAAECEALARDFAAVFSMPPLTLQPAGAEGFVLRGMVPTDAVTHDPARVLGADIAPGLPAGSGASLLRKLGSEIELWLHDHAVNRARVARAERPVTTLWLWGGHASDAAVAQAPRGPVPTALSRARKPQGQADELWMAALWHALEAPFAPAPASIDALATGSDVVAVVRNVEAVEAESAWVEPALHQIASGCWRSVSIVLADGVYRFRAFDLWKPWRRRSAASAVRA